MRSIVSSARFAALPALQCVAIITFIIGGAFTWLAGGMLTVGILLLDEAGGDYRDPVIASQKVLFEAFLYAAVPLSVLMTFGLILQTASPGSPLGDLATVTGAGGELPWVAITGALFSTGMIFGATAAFAHELFHRPSRLDWSCAQLLLTQCLYAPMAIEHVYGHHRNVGLPHDIVTVPRKMTLWRYLPRAVVGTYHGAAGIEARRMRHKGQSPLNRRNRFLQGLILQAVLVAGVLALGGSGGLLGFAASAAIAVVFIEMANYVGHYGIVRVPGRPVLPRHSWNGPRFLSTSLFINLQRHSDHHRSASRPYWRLTVLEDAPVYPLGMSLMAAIALIPPLWFRIIDPLLKDWDRRLASPEEVRLIGESAPMDTGKA